MKQNPVLSPYNPGSRLELVLTRSTNLMAKSTLPVIQALRDTAQRLATQAPYQWGHMGSCNCGHLAQTITRLTKAEIHARAMQRYGDWERQLIDYCPTSGLPIDQTIDEMPWASPGKTSLTSNASATLLFGRPFPSSAAMPCDTISATT
jgi:hypothetical protein